MIGGYLLARHKSNQYEKKKRMGLIAIEGSILRHKKKEYKRKKYLKRKQ